MNSCEVPAGNRLADSLGMKEAFRDHRGKPARSFPSAFPVLRLDRIYVRGFAPQTQHLLSVTKGGPGNGTVTSDPAGINCGGDCLETYDTGTVVPITATLSTTQAVARLTEDMTQAQAEAEAIQLVRSIEPFRPYFVEDLLHPEDYAGVVAFEYEKVGGNPVTVNGDFPIKSEPDYDAALAALG